MEEICGGQKPYLSEGHLEAEHLRIHDKAIFQVSTVHRRSGPFASYYHLVSYSY